MCTNINLFPDLTYKTAAVHPNFGKPSSPVPCRNDPPRAQVGPADPSLPRLVQEPQIILLHSRSSVSSKHVSDRNRTFGVPGMAVLFCSDP